MYWPDQTGDNRPLSNLIPKTDSNIPVNFLRIILSGSVLDSWAMIAGSEDLEMWDPSAAIAPTVDQLTTSHSLISWTSPYLM